MRIDRTSSAVALAFVALAFLGCRQDMHDQAKYEPYEVSDFFADGQASRQPVPGTVARGWLREDPHLYRGIGPDGGFATTLPMPLTRELVERGRERYDIFCSPCHGRTGDGGGMVVQRGFKQPASLHETRLRDMPYGYYVGVMSTGFGEMSSYAAQVPVEDRWAIAGYVRALQFSRQVDASRLTDADRRQLEATK